ncbi:L-rhamnose/proton symporter RhaT [Saccharicrinis aurantiacus]|uniref:L-rhamnose/proton symporter RhaT n=1 Tax=Saccharicrinis aurantiacus TaxID=1849719 RepID=UPI00094FC677|nr:L-rhamnose/proton symporter RhaT [Saccharicrinis aurantiacus]
MIQQNPLMGTLLHAVGGVSASTCYVPFQKVKQWNWNSYWLVQATFAWLIFPLIVGYITVPNLWEVFAESPFDLIVKAFLLGSIYGFGGMCFGYAIKHIGYSLTYTISIGISAILGTIVPLIMHGELISKFHEPGGNIIYLGMLISLIGISLCGVAGYRKEKDLTELNKESGEKSSFNMKKGFTLTLIAGVLSAVFGISLEVGAPIAEIAGKHGAGHFEGNANLMLSTMGAFATNLIWFVVVGIKQKTLKEIVDVKGLGGKTIGLNMFMSIISGALWYGQFFFYNMAHVRMGGFKFASWVIHMSMLIFFSYILGIVMKEWSQVSKRTYRTLVFALAVLISSFLIMTYGSSMGTEAIGH